MKRKISTNEMKAKRSLFKRVCICCFTLLLCLGFVFIPFQKKEIQSSIAASPTDNPPAVTEKASVSIAWDSSVKFEPSASSEAEKYTRPAASTNSHRHIRVSVSGPVAGVKVTVRIISFDVSASAKNGDYTAIDQSVELVTGGERSVETISVAPSKQRRFADVGSGSEAAATTEPGTAKAVTHTRVFGIKIASVSSNATIDSTKNTLYARTGYDTGTITGGSGSYYLTRNLKDYLPKGVEITSQINNGYTYSTVLTSGTNVTYDKVLKKEWNIEANGSRSVSFYAADSIKGTSAESYKSYFADTELYFTGKFKISDTLALSTKGVDIKLTESGNDTPLATPGLKSMNYDNEKVNWLESKIHDTWGYSSRVKEISGRGGGYGNGYEHFIKDSGNKVTWKITLRYYGKDVYNNTLSTILVNEEKPKIMDISVWDGGAHGYGKGDSIKIAVRFSKPVQLARTSPANNPDFQDLQLVVNVGGNRELFQYDGGSYTDTLIFSSRKLDGTLANVSCDDITVESFYSDDKRNPEDWHLLVGDMMCNTSNSNNTADTTGWSNLNKRLSCKIDTREPSIKVHPSSLLTEREHTVQVELANMGTEGKLYYAWTEEPDRYRVSSWTEYKNFKVGTGEENYNAISSGAQNGKVYLHLRAVGTNGVIVEEFGGLYSFDNTGPSVDVSSLSVQYALYQKTHTLKLYAMDDKLSSLGIGVGVGSIDLHVEKKNADGTFNAVSGYPRQVYSVGASNNLMKTDGDGANVYTMTLSHTDVGLAENTWGEYRVGFTVKDSLGNVAQDDEGKLLSVLYDSRALFFDSRNTYEAGLYSATGKSGGELTSDKTYDTLPVFYNQVDGEPFAMTVCSAEEIGDSDTFALLSVTVDGKLAYNDGAWLNERTYYDYGFNVDPATQVTRDDTPNFISMKGYVEFNAQACGYYEFIYKKANGQQSSTVRAYISPLYTETVNYKSLYAPDRLLVNRVWQIQSVNYYSQTKAEKIQPYSGRANWKPIFSSRDKAVEYVTYMEYQDISLEVLTTEEAAQLQDGNYSTMKKATGKDPTAEAQPDAKAGHTWLRYKSHAWNLTSGADEDYWVYYYIADSALTSITVQNVLGNALLKEAIEDNVIDIVGEEKSSAELLPDTNFMLTPLNGNGVVDEYGQPYYFEGAIFYDALVFTRVNEGGSEQENAGKIYSHDLSYSGDPAIYSSFISTLVNGEEREIPIVANYRFEAATNYQKIYYREADGTNRTWKMIADGETLKQKIKTTGVYEIAECNGGYKTYFIYCDFSAPILKYDAVLGESTLTDSKFTSVNHDPNGQLTVGSITLKGFLMGEDALSGWSEELDEYAYVYLTKYSSTDSGVKSVFYSAYELKLLLSQGKDTVLPSGKYRMAIYDRLGNRIETVIRTNPTPIVETEPYINDAKTLINFTVNRSVDEIVSFEIKRDGEVVQSVHDGRARYSYGQSGYYYYRVEDIYGNVFTESKKEFIREAPQVTFEYFNGTSYTKVRVTPIEETPAETGAVVRQAYRIVEEEIDGETVERVEYVNNSFSISTMADIRLTTTTHGYYECFIDNPAVSVVKGSGQGGRSTYTIPYDKGAWIFRLRYEDDPSDLSTLFVSCKEDVENPIVDVTVETPVYKHFDVLKDDNQKDVLGNVLFNPDPNTFEYREDKVTNGSRVSGRSMTFEWSDDTGIISVSYTFNDQDPVTLQADEGKKTVTDIGKYTFTVVDLLGNRTVFETELTNSLDFYVEMGSQRISHYVDPQNHITGVGADAKWNSPLYTGKDLHIYMRETMTLALLYQTHGKKVVYYIDYYDSHLIASKLTILNGTDGEIDLTEAATAEVVEGANGQFLKDGSLLLHYKIENGVVVLSAPEPTTYELFQLRFTNRSNNGSPCIVQIERSNEKPDLVLYGERGQLLANGLSYTGINTKLELRLNTVSIKDIVQVVAYRSQEEFYDYSGITDQLSLKSGDTLGSITEDGYYIIVAKNKYGNEQLLLVRINSKMTIEVRIAYAGENVPERIFEDVFVREEAYYFYSNKEIYLNIWNPELQVEMIEGDGVLLQANKDGYRWFSVRDKGAFTLKVYDACENVYIIHGEIGQPTPLSYSNYMTGFNEKAVRKEENYTNAPIDLHLQNMQNAEVCYAAYRRQGEDLWVPLYDVLSQRRVDENGENFEGCIGQSNGTYEVLFTDKYGNERIEVVHVSNAEQITVQRKIQASSGEQKIALYDAMSVGVWSNYVVTITNTAQEYRLLVQDELVQFNENGQYRWELPLTKAEGDEVYTFAYVDEYGNEYAFNVHLYRKVPTVKAAMVGEQISSAGALYVKGDVAYTWEDDGITATYVRDSQKAVAYRRGELLTEDGSYVITFTDRAGNKTTAHITRDTKVSCYLMVDGKEIPYGISTSRGVSIGTREADVQISTVTRNGERIAAKISDTFIADGSYVVVLMDKIGNVTELAFDIYANDAQSFLYTANKAYVISQIWLESGDVRLPYVSDVTVDAEGRQQYQFHVDGSYEVELYHEETNSYFKFQVTIDNVAPVAELVGVTAGGITRENVSLANLREGDIVDVYCNGRLLSTYEYSQSQAFPEIDQPGRYRVVVRDEAGNEIVYEFEREFTTNVAANAIICISLFGISILGIVFVRGRERIRTK